MLLDMTRLRTIPLRESLFILIGGERLQLKLRLGHAESSMTICRKKKQTSWFLVAINVHMGKYPLGISVQWRYSSEIE